MGVCAVASKVLVSAAEVVTDMSNRGGVQQNKNTAKYLTARAEPHAAVYTIDDLEVKVCLFNFMNPNVSWCLSCLFSTFGNGTSAAEIVVITGGV